MAPEVILEEDYDTRADIYSFAYCLFEMVFGPNPLRQLPSESPYRPQRSMLGYSYHFKKKNSRHNCAQCGGRIQTALSGGCCFAGNETTSGTLLVTSSRTVTKLFS